MILKSIYCKKNFSEGTLLNMKIDEIVVISIKIVQTPVIRTAATRIEHTMKSLSKTELSPTPSIIWCAPIHTFTPIGTRKCMASLSTTPSMRPPSPKYGQ